MAQPNPVRGSLVPWFALLFFGFALGLFVFLTADRRQVLAETYAFEPLESAQSTRVVFTEPFELKDGFMHVPTGPGIGVDPIPETLRRFTTATRVLYAND